MMNIMIARPGSGESPRVFPDIGPDLYESADAGAGRSPDERVARRLLALGLQGFSARERAKVRGLDGVGHLSRLLFHHRLAFQAELAGQTGRADFFWREFDARLGRLWPQARLWDEVRDAVREPGAEVMGDAAQLRRRLMHEVLLDTNCAFYNGRLREVETPAADDRLFAHSDRLVSLLEWADLGRADLRALLAPPAQLKIKACEAAGQFDRAAAAAGVLVAFLPDVTEYQNQLAGLHFAAALNNLSDGTDTTAALGDAGRLRPRIQALGKLHSAFPANLVVLRLLAHLHRVRAVRLANGGRLAEALEVVQRAATLDPSAEEIQETRQQLMQAMHELQEQVRLLERQVAATPNARLSGEGLKWQREARKGFGPMTEYADSAEAKQSVGQFRRTQARALWLAVGLPAPTEDWDARALALSAACAQLLNEPPGQEAQVAARWQEIAAGDALLSGLDQAAVSEYLRRRLFTTGEEDGADEAAARPDPPPPAAPPVLAAQAASGRGGEPFAYWLLSGQNPWLKALAATAVVILLVAAALGGRESWYSRARDRAWREALAAKDQRRHGEVIAAAESFLSHPPLGGRDSREGRVIGFYQEALVRSALGAGGESDAALRARFDRYRRFVPESKQAE
jgi:tetratricopeptide (TPR) repeat protein